MQLNQFAQQNTVLECVKQTFISWVYRKQVIAVIFILQEDVDNIGKGILLFNTI